jgi:hypothetical protein
MGFKEIDVMWNRFIRITLFNENNIPNTIGARCYPNYNEQVKKAENNISESKNGHLQKKWNYISCSSELTNGYFLINDSQYQQTSVDKDLMDTSDTYLKIAQPLNAVVNFGVIFLKELKLWSMYDLRNYYTNCS